jgi:hypothetical protein
MDALTTSLRLRVNHNQFCTIYHIFLDQYYILNHMSLLYKKKSYESILLKNNHISLYSFGRWKYVISHEQRCCHSQVTLAHDVDRYLLLVQ